MENYEKKYKEAFERALKIHNEHKAQPFNVMQKVFPELAESEDEKIRKSLLEYLHTLPNHYSQNGVCAPEWITWIEKQSEQKPADKFEPRFNVGDWIISKYMHLVMQILNNDNGSYKTVEIDGTERNDSYDFIERNFKLWIIQDAEPGDVLVAPPLKGYEGGEQIFMFKNINSRDYEDECIEYYCRVCEGVFYENKNCYMGTTSEPLYPATKEQRDLLFTKMKEANYEWDFDKKELKKIEQKPADEVEPKFKIGDWIIWDNKISCHIDNIYQGKESLMYTITDANNMTRSYSVKGFDNNSHLWAIQDAKDGDVLATLDYILIFKEHLKNDGGLSYCHYDFGSGNPQFIWFEDNNWYFGKEAVIHPATKEQRGILFQKMKEAGYEWNTKKKELKKIEQNQKSNDDIKYEIIEFIRSRGGFKQEYLNYIVNTCNKNKLIKDICKWLKNYAKSYVNCEYNWHHQCYEYDGTVDTDEMIKALKNKFEK